MEAALSELIKALLPLGLPGVLLIAAGFWIHRQASRIDKLTDDLITMSGEMAKASTEMSAAMNRLADSVRGRAE